MCFYPKEKRLIFPSIISSNQIKKAITLSRPSIHISLPPPEDELDDNQSNLSKSQAQNLYLSKLTFERRDSKFSISGGTNSSRVDLDTLRRMSQSVTKNQGLPRILGHPTNDTKHVKSPFGRNYMGKKENSQKDNLGNSNSHNNTPVKSFTSSINNFTDSQFKRGEQRENSIASISQDSVIIARKMASNSPSLHFRQHSIASNCSSKKSSSNYLREPMSSQLRSCKIKNTHSHFSNGKLKSNFSSRNNQHEFTFAKGISRNSLLQTPTYPIKKFLSGSPQILRRKFASKIVIGQDKNYDSDSESSSSLSSRDQQSHRMSIVSSRKGTFGPIRVGVLSKNNSQNIKNNIGPISGKYSPVDSQNQRPLKEGIRPSFLAITPGLRSENNRNRMKLTGILQAKNPLPQNGLSKDGSRMQESQSLSSSSSSYIPPPPKQNEKNEQNEE